MVSETATTGFLGRISEAMRSAAEELGEGPKSRRITGIGVAGFSITAQLPPAQQLGWRQLGEQLLQLLEEKRTGLAITLALNFRTRGELRPRSCHWGCWQSSP